MNIPTALCFLRLRLAALAEEQIEVKRARRPLPPSALVALAKKLGADFPDQWNPQRDVAQRRARITACLNLYHELRGSAHRHGIREGWEWAHRHELETLREEIARLG